MQIDRGEEPEPPAQEIVVPEGHSGQSNRSGEFPPPPRFEAQPGDGGAAGPGPISKAFPEGHSGQSNRSGEFPPPPRFEAQPGDGGAAGPGPISKASSPKPIRKSTSGPVYDGESSWTTPEERRAAFCIKSLPACGLYADVAPEGHSANRSLSIEPACDKPKWKL
jgi:hypothetical protein